MAYVRLQLADVGKVDVEITIRATARELDEYAHNVRPSHALGHRLQEAITDALSQLRTTVTKEITTGEAPQG